MPRPWAASSAEATWRAMEIASRVGTRPRAIRSARVGPSTSSMINARAAPSGSNPWTVAMFGWLSEASTKASRSNHD